MKCKICGMGDDMPHEPDLCKARKLAITDFYGTIDSVSIKEVLPDGTLSDNLLTNQDFIDWSDWNGAKND
jgi:hypothetical protein